MDVAAVFDRIAEDIGVAPGDNEKRSVWRCRVAYSAAVRRGLDSLWDYDEDEGTGEDEIGVSVRHLTETIGRVLNIFRFSDSSLVSLLNAPLQQMKHESLETVIRDLLSAGGYFYHRNFRAVPVAPSRAALKGVIFLRGAPSGSLRRMSGAGVYRACHEQGAWENVARMFGLRSIMSMEDVAKLEMSLPDVAVDVQSGGYEFLRLDRSRNGSYWKDMPDERVLSLARAKQGRGEGYFFYRLQGGRFFCRSLPAWHVEKRRYLELAAALITQRQPLPPILVRRRGPVVEVCVGYRFPPEAETFFRLYAWPDFEKGRAFPFYGIMVEPVFTAFQNIMTHLGYSFEEMEHD